MATIAELNAQYETLRKTLGEFQEEWKGKDLPEAESQKRDAMLADLDRIENETKGLVERHESDVALEARLAGADNLFTKSRGLLPGMGNGVKADAPSGPEQKGGWVGAETKAGFVPVWSTEEYERIPAVKASCTPEYRQVFQRYVKALRSQDLTAEDWTVLHRGEAKALTEGTDTAGGFLVPVEFLAEMIMRKPGSAVMRAAGATVIQASRDRVEIPRLAAASTDATMYSSAVSVTDVSETPTETSGETEPVFEQIAVNIHMVKAFTKLSRNLVADAAFNVTGLLTSEFSRAVDLGLDDRYFTGNGVGKPVGLINDSSITTVNSGHASQLTSDGIKDLVYDLAAQYHASAKFALSLSALKAIRKLQTSAGDYIWEPGAGHGVETGVPPTIEGKPYIATDFLDTVGAGNKPIVFGDFSAFWIVDRDTFSLEVLRELYAPQNMIGYVGFRRYGATVVNPQAFRIQVVSASA